MTAAKLLSMTAAKIMTAAKTPEQEAALDLTERDVLVLYEISAVNTVCTLRKKAAQIFIIFLSKRTVLILLIMTAARS